MPAEEINLEMKSLAPLLIANKHKVNSVQIIVRIVLEHYLASPEFKIPANKASTFEKLFEESQLVNACARVRHFNGQNLTKPKFYLQETRERGLHRSCRFPQITWDRTKKYEAWYQYNVVLGKQQNLKVEIHLRTSRGAMLERVGQYVAKRMLGPYQPWSEAEAEMANKETNRHLIIALADCEETEDELMTSALCIDEELKPTWDWFPVREAALKPRAAKTRNNEHTCEDDETSRQKPKRRKIDLDAREFCGSVETWGRQDIGDMFS